MKMVNDLDNTFSITIEYSKKRKHSKDIFEAMSGLISAFEQFDQHVLDGIDSKIEVYSTLEDIEVSSLKVKFKNLIEGIPDESIRDFDWKKIIGHFLLKGKHFLVEKLSDSNIEISKDSLIDLQSKIINEAEETHIKQIPIYRTIPLILLTEDLERINRSIKLLSAEEHVYFESRIKKDRLHSRSNIDFEIIKDQMFEAEQIAMKKMILMIKKPDYLGFSKWDFKSESKSFQAKILDGRWLKKFQNREIVIKPHDSIEANVKVIFKYSYEKILTEIIYEVVEVIRVVPNSDPQISLIEFDE